MKPTPKRTPNLEIIDQIFEISRTSALEKSCTAALCYMFISEDFLKVSHSSDIFIESKVSSQSFKGEMCFVDFSCNIFFSVVHYNLFSTFFSFFLSFLSIGNRFTFIIKTKTLALSLIDLN